MRKGYPALEKSKEWHCKCVGKELAYLLTVQNDFRKITSQFPNILNFLKSVY